MSYSRRKPKKRDLECEKFDLQKVVTYVSLALLCFCVLGGFYFAATRITDDKVKGVLVAGAIGGICKLIHVLYKALTQKKE